MKTQTELSEELLTQDELARLNGVGVGTEVLIGSTKWRVDEVHGNSVDINDASRGTAGIRTRLKHLFDDRGFLSYNSLRLSRTSGLDESGSVATKTATRLKHLFDDKGFLSYNFLNSSRISGGDDRLSFSTNTITRTPGFIVQLPEEVDRI